MDRMTRLPIFTFDTTHHALWAEEIATERRIPCEVIPAPPQAAARCNLALQTLPEDVPVLAEELRVEGVSFSIWTGAEVEPRR